MLLGGGAAAGRACIAWLCFDCQIRLALFSVFCFLFSVFCFLFSVFCFRFVFVFDSGSAVNDDDDDDAR